MLLLLFSDNCVLENSCQWLDPYSLVWCNGIAWRCLKLGCLVIHSRLCEEEWYLWMLSSVYWTSWHLFQILRHFQLVGGCLMGPNEWLWHCFTRKTGKDYWMPLFRNEFILKKIESKLEMTQVKLSSLNGLNHFE